MHLTPAMLRACYAFLRDTPPFRRWRLPDPDAIKFRVLVTKEFFGQCTSCGGKYEIDVSVGKVGHTITLIKTMAHEMAHMRADIIGGGMGHGKVWQGLIDQISRHHGWDAKEL